MSLYYGDGFQIYSISIRDLFLIVGLVGCFVLTSCFPIPIKKYARFKGKTAKNIKTISDQVILSRFQ